MLRLIPVFASTLFLSINFGVLLYVNSTFLGRFFPAGAVSAIFLAASAINILLFLIAPRLLSYFGKERLLFIFIAGMALGNIWLASAGSAWAAACAFIIYESLLFMVYYCLDIFVEAKSVDSHTGGIRGVYTSIINAGIMAGPLLLAFLSRGDNLTPFYVLASGLLFVPLIHSLASVLRNGTPAKARTTVLLPVRSWWRQRNIRAVTLAKLSLETFYGVMVIYTPIYLHGTLGFTWAELGLIFTVMLLPFVILEWPAGELADHKLGEKEMMSAGFFLMGMMLLAMPFPEKRFLAWMLILFLSRVGAALVEIMTETYFFKKIDAKDTGTLAIFRIMRPLGVLSGALLGFVLLQFFSLEKIFFALAFIVFFGMREALYLKDTR